MIDPGVPMPSGTTHAGSGEAEASHAMSSNGRPLQVSRPGRVPYEEALRLQRELVARRRDGEIPDQLVLLEHPHVITLGTGASREHVLADPSVRRRLGVELHTTTRGGDVTYHGPGQLVGYPILDLKPDRKDVHRYLRDLEEVLIRVMASYGIEGFRSEGFTGVWTEAGKVAALGVRVSSRWITSHGFAFNVSPDLSYFETIVPCGLEGRRVTSLAELLGHAPGEDDVARRVTEAFADVFGRVVAPGHVEGVG